MITGVPYDAEIEYLESTGTQWIDTGVTPNADTVWFTRCKFTEYAQSKCGTAWRTGGMAFVQRTDSQTMLYTRGWYCNYDTTVNPGLNMFTVEIDGSHAGVKVNGVWRRAQDNLGWVNTGNTEQIRLFAGYETIGTPRVVAGKMKIFESTISVSGILVHDFIPVRVGTVGFLYDRVTRRLYGNSGTGSFVLGPDVARPVLPTRVVSVKPYDAEIEYLESTGTQYIDTGVSIADGAFDMGVDFDSTYTSNNCAVAVQGDATSGTTNQKRFVFYHSGSSTVYTIDRGTAGDRITNYGYTVDTGKLAYTIVLNSAKHVLICRSNGVPSVGNLRGCVRYFRLWDSTDTLVRDFIPVRIGTTGFFYDKVSGQLFGNAGTGSFVLGPDVSVERSLAGLIPIARNVRILPYDAEVDYVESTGAQYVDTRVVPVFTTFSFSATLAATVTSGTTGLIGCRQLQSNSVYNIFVVDGNYRFDMAGQRKLQATAYEPISMACTPSTVTVGSVVWPRTESSDAPFSFLLGTFRDNREPRSPMCPQRIYEVTMVNSGILIRDFIPVRIGTTGYLYDRANPTGGPLGNGLYGSATSTPLIAGPDK